MEHRSANEFSETEFPIKNALDGSPIHREMPCPYSSTREGKLLLKALESWAHRNQRSFRPFFVAAGKIAELESLEPIIDDGQ
jgi:hypothetical protein